MEISPSIPYIHDESKQSLLLNQQNNISDLVITKLGVVHDEKVPNTFANIPINKKISLISLTVIGLLIRKLQYENGVYKNSIIVWIVAGSILGYLYSKYDGLKDPVKYPLKYYYVFKGNAFHKISKHKMKKKVSSLYQAKVYSKSIYNILPPPEFYTGKSEVECDFIQKRLTNQIQKDLEQQEKTISSQATFYQVTIGLFIGMSLGTLIEQLSENPLTSIKIISTLTAAISIDYLFHLSYLYLKPPLVNVHDSKKKEKELLERAENHLLRTSFGKFEYTPSKTAPKKGFSFTKQTVQLFDKVISNLSPELTLNKLFTLSFGGTVLIECIDELYLSHLSPLIKSVISIITIVSILWTRLYLVSTDQLPIKIKKFWIPMSRCVSLVVISGLITLLFFDKLSKV